MIFATQKGFKGIDHRGAFGADLGVASEMVNFRINESGALVKRQGIRHIFEADNEINGVWRGILKSEEVIIFAAGGKLYRISPYGTPEPLYIGDIGNGRCVMFEFNNWLYIKCADYYGKYDGETFMEVEGYIPLVAISCTPQGEGQIFEQINLICDKRRQRYSANGSSMFYYLAEKEIDGIDSITLDGKPYEGEWSSDKHAGTISFKNAVPAGLNNLEITYRKGNGTDSRSRILGCSRIMMFGGNSDGRIFLWGNPQLPNYRFYSDLADGVPSAEYFPVNGFTVIGNKPINCIVQQYDKQLIFAEDKAYYSYCELKTDSLGRVYSSFPVFSLNGEKGCIFETDGCVIDNKPVTLCRDGFNMWESTAVVNEKNAINFSAPICNFVPSFAGSSNKDFCMFDFLANRELFFIFGEFAYIYNYGLNAWYSYDNFGGKHHFVYGDLVYFAKGKKLCSFGNHQEEDLEHLCIWKSAFLGNGKKDCNLLEFSADMYIRGNCGVRIQFEKSGNAVKTLQEFDLNDQGERFLRITARPRRKRALPFRIWFTDMGTGKMNLYGFVLKTRDTERRNRFGLL